MTLSTHFKKRMCKFKFNLNKWLHVCMNSNRICIQTDTRSGHFDYNLKVEVESTFSFILATIGQGKRPKSFCFFIWHQETDSWGRPIHDHIQGTSGLLRNVPPLIFYSIPDALPKLPYCHITFCHCQPKITP